MCHSEVGVLDAVFSVLLIESSSDFGHSPETDSGPTNPLHISFPEDPLAQYKMEAERILCGLGLDHLW